jgi:branched-chain amino acid transport system permease protein
MCLTQNFWAFFVTGVALGALYALIALGYTLVYGVLQLINFAHSEVFMSGAFGGLFALQAVVGSSQPHGIASAGYVLLGIAAGGVSGGVAAWLLERVAYRPLRRRHAPPLAYLISALYNNGTAFRVFGTPVQTTSIIIVVATLLMLVVLDRVINATRLGQGIRAVAQDAQTASLMGVDIDKIIVITFVLGGVFGGVAGFLYGMAFNVSFNMGFIPGLKAFTAAVLGGIGNVRGAVLGGLLLGIVESLSVACMDVKWQNVIAFLILVLVLMIRPTGLLGERLGRAA